MDYRSKFLEEALRESACIGDGDTLVQLISSGINVNSQNSVNGWSALHWAARRNHKKIVQLLIENGADPKLKNKNGETPANVALDKDMGTLLGETGPITSSNLPITPSYLKYPALPITKNLELDRVMSMINKRININESVILKVRLAGSDPDFIEVELSKAELTVEKLIEVCCRELNVESGKIIKVRKLPNTLIRKCRDVQRLSDYQEIELCCM